MGDPIWPQLWPFLCFCVSPAIPNIEKIQLYEVWCSIQPQMFMLTPTPTPRYIIYSYICIHARVSCIFMDVSTASAASPAHTHPSRKEPTKGVCGAKIRLSPCRGGAKRRPLSGWMCVGWWGSRCGGNIHKYAWNMRMYAYIAIYIAPQWSPCEPA